MDKRRKDRIVKGIVLNVFVFTASIVYITVIILPKYIDIGVLTDKVNATAQNISSLEKDGVNKDSFVELLTRLERKKEVSDVIFSDSAKLNNVLKKPANVTKDYLTWLIEENSKINTLDKEIQENDKILGNIIPIFVNSSSASAEKDVDNQITLGSFISYVEKNILGKYSLSSYAPLGISNITFPDKKDTPVNIGSFKITLDFKGKNSDILSFIKEIQQSGKLTIRNGKLISVASVDSVS